MLMKNVNFDDAYKCKYVQGGGVVNDNFFTWDQVSITFELEVIYCSYKVFMKALIVFYYF